MMPGSHIRSMDELEQAREQWHDVYEDSGMKLPVLTYEYVKLLLPGLLQFFHASYVPAWHRLLFPPRFLWLALVHANISLLSIAWPAPALFPLP